MTRKFTWWQILCGIIELIAITLMILCLTTDVNDDLFIQAALCCTAVANVTLLVMNRRQLRKPKD